MGSSSHAADVQRGAATEHEGEDRSDRQQAPGRARRLYMRRGALAEHLFTERLHGRDALSLVCNRLHIIAALPVDELVVRVNSRLAGLAVHNNFYLGLGL